MGKEVRIGDLFEIEKGSLQSSKSINGKYNFITAAEAWKTHESFSHNTEALVFAAAASGSLGRTHYVNGKFIASDLCFILTPKDLNKYYVDLKFYHFVFNNLREQIVKATKTGTSKDSINITNFSNYEIPYIQKFQQIEWIEKLKKTERIQNELLRKSVQQEDFLHKLRQSILQEAVQGKLTKQDPKDEPAEKLLQRIKAEKQKMIAAGKLKKEKELPPITEDEIPYKLPNGWVWCRLGELVLKSEAGKSLVCEKRKAEFPEWGIVKVSAMSWGEFDENESKVLPKDISPTLEYKILKGDYLISRANTDELIGKSVIVGDIKSNLLLSDKSIRIVFSEFVSKVFINLFNNSLIAREYYKSVATGTSNSMKNISREQMYMMPVPFPPLSEQQRIVAKVEHLMQIANQLEQQVQQSKEQAQQLLQAVLKEAFTNKRQYEENDVITMAAEQ
jgi:type I restriction enzyme S subunit